MADDPRALIRIPLMKRLTQAMSYGFTGAMFAPMSPLPPQYPETAGRRFDYPPGYNISTRPRRDTGIDFQALRNFAQFYDVLRILIEKRKDQISNFEWSIVPTDEVVNKGAIPKAGGKKNGVDKELDDQAQAATEFLKYPDGRTPWMTWLRQVVEDMLVLDAIVLYPVYQGKQLLRLESVDPATIKIIIDESGRRPEPPYPAYQQSLKGVPTSNYCKDELLYFISNPSSNMVYGRSKVENILITIQIGLRKEFSALQLFTDGNVPAALAGVPDTWDAKQIAILQSAFDSMLAGDTAARRKIWFIPGDAAKNIKEFVSQESTLKTEFDEWLIRIMCFNFGITPQPFIKEQNRATAFTGQQEARDEGLGPVLGFLKTVIDTIIHKALLIDGLEFKWSMEPENDPTSQSAIDDQHLKNGSRSLDELRQRDGFDPYGIGAMVYLATGPILVSSIKDGSAQYLQPKEPPPQIGADGKPQPGKPNGSGKQLAGNKPKQLTDQRKPSQSGLKEDNVEKPLANKMEARARSTASPFFKRGSVTQLAQAVGRLLPPLKADLHRTLGAIGQQISRAAWKRIQTARKLGKFAPDEARDPQGKWTAEGGQGVDKDLIERAVNSFGLTTDPREAGYILPDGRMLDFSAKSKGGQPGQRAQDHREVGRLSTPEDPLFDKEKAKYGYWNTDKAMVTFIERTGALRVHSDDGKSTIATIIGQPSDAALDRLVRNSPNDLMIAIGTDLPSGHGFPNEHLFREPTTEHVRSWVSNYYFHHKTKKLAKDDASITTAHGIVFVGEEIEDILDAIEDADWFTVSGVISPAMQQVFEEAGYSELVATGNANTAKMLDTLDKEAVTYARTRSAELVTSISESTRDQLRGTIEDALSEGWGQDELTTEIENNFAFSEYRSAMISHTELAFAHSRGRVGVAKEAGAVGKRWLLSSDHDDNEDCNCSDCADAGVVDMDDDFVPGEDFPPSHPNCCLPGTFVAASGVSAHYKRWFAGEVVVICVAGINDLTVTPNHPILTDRGWVAAGALQVHDRLIQCLTPRAVLLVPENHYVETMIEDVPSSLMVAGKVSSVRMPLAPEDFHGDAAAGTEVHIVRTDSKLRFDHVAVGHQLSHDGVLAGRQSVQSEAMETLHGALAEFVERIGAPAQGNVSGLSHGAALPGGYPGEPQLVGGAIVSNWQPGGLPSVAQRGAMAFQLPREIDTRLAGHVAFVEIENLSVREFHGHVFNLETADGWYVANSIITHNCLCDWAGVYPGDEDSEDDGSDTETTSPEEAEQDDEEEAAGKFEKVAIDDAAHEAATSPLNDKPQPNPWARARGVYAMGHINVGGLDIAIENPQGSHRDPTKPWPALSTHYGYVKRTEGADDEEVDVLLKPGCDEHYDGPVFVIDQIKPDGSFDEHKACVGWLDKDSAIAAYLANYQVGWKVGPTTQMTLAQFKDWLVHGDTTTPVKKYTPDEERDAHGEWTAGAEEIPLPKRTGNQVGGIHELKQFGTRFPILVTPATEADGQRFAQLAKTMDEGDDDRGHLRGDFSPDTTVRVWAGENIQVAFPAILGTHPNVLPTLRRAGFVGAWSLHGALATNHEGLFKSIEESGGKSLATQRHAFELADHGDLTKDFDPALHPRDETGRFADTGGGKQPEKRPTFTQPEAQRLHEAAQAKPGTATRERNVNEAMGRLAAEDAAARGSKPGTTTRALQERDALRLKINDAVDRMEAARNAGDRPAFDAAYAEHFQLVGQQRAAGDQNQPKLVQPPDPAWRGATGEAAYRGGEAPKDPAPRGPTQTSPNQESLAVTANTEQPHTPDWRGAPPHYEPSPLTHTPSPEPTSEANKPNTSEIGRESDKPSTYEGTPNHDETSGGRGHYDASLQGNGESGEDFVPSSDSPAGDTTWKDGAERHMDIKGDDLGRHGAKDLSVIKNPTQSEVNAWADRQDSPVGELRYGIDTSAGNVFVWDASMAIHQPVMRTLGLGSRDQYETMRANSDDIPSTDNFIEHLEGKVNREGLSTDTIVSLNRESAPPPSKEPARTPTPPTHDPYDDNYQRALGIDDLAKIVHPHKIRSGKKWKVVDDDGHVFGTFSSEKKANLQLAALYAAKDQEAKKICFGCISLDDDGLIKYNPDEPRVPPGESGGGQWTSGGAGEPKPDAQGKYHVGNNLDLAVKLIGEGKDVVLEQPRQIATLMDRLAAIGKEAKAAGEKAKIYDLCHVSVPDTNIFCAGNKGIARAEMPQLSGKPLPGSRADGLAKDKHGEVDLSKEFAKHMGDHGGVSKEKEDAAYLRASQRELDGVKVATIMQKIESGEAKDRRIWVTKDNYILDGHHNWAARVALEYATGKTINMKVYRTGTSIIPTINAARKFANDWGLPQRAVGKFRKGDQPGHEFHGNQWTGGEGAGAAPAWWNEPSDNKFARGMTNAQVTMEWLTNHKVEQNPDGTYRFYHGSPNATLPHLAAGSLLAQSEKEARRFAAHDRGLRQKDMHVYVVSVKPWEIRGGSIWASVRENYTAKMAKYSPDQPRDSDGRWASGGSESVPAKTDSELAEAIKAHGGFTYQPFTHDAPKPGDDVYSVSPYQDREQILNDKELTPAQLHDYVIKNADLLKDPTKYFGAWHDTESGKVFLDTVIVTPSLEEARQIGLLHNQIAAFSFKTMSTVDIKPERRAEL
jgi:hypothetical protein